MRVNYVGAGWALSHVRLERCNQVSVRFKLIDNLQGLGFRGLSLQGLAIEVYVLRLFAEKLVEGFVLKGCAKIARSMQLYRVSQQCAVGNLNPKPLNPKP